MNISDLLSSSTKDAISTDLQAAMLANAIQYSQDAFLGDQIGGAYLELQNYPDSPTEALKRWYQPPVVGNTDPTKKVPHGTQSWKPGTPGILNFTAVSSNEDNFYRYMVVDMPAKLPTEFRDSRGYALGNLPAWQGLEWQFQLQMGGQKYTAAWQLSTASGVRLWDMTLKDWKATSIPLPDLTRPVVAECDFLTTPNSLTHAYIVLNGKQYDVNNVQPTVPTSVSKFTICDQVDPKRGGAGTMIANRISLRFV